MLSVQEAPAARVEVQPLVCAKPVPLVETVKPERLVVAVFLIVTVCAALAVLVAWFPKAIEVGVTLSGRRPVPVRLTLWAPPLLSVNARFPLEATALVGLKVTEKVQEAEAARLLPQVLVWAKGAGTDTPEIPRAAVVLLVRVTVLAALVVPTIWFPNASEVGDRVKAAMPVPVRLPVRTGPTEGVTVKLPFCAPTAVGVNVIEIVQEPLAGIEPPHVSVSA